MEDITIELTTSGYPRREFLYKGEFIKFNLDGKNVDAWKSVPPEKFMLNALAVETFRTETYPIVDVKITDKPGIGPLRRWFFGDRPCKIYDIIQTAAGSKTVTYLKLVSGREVYVDENAGVIKAAINSVKNGK
jgi:hypothetical protein